MLGSRISSSFAELKGYKHVTNAVRTSFPGFLILHSLAPGGGKVSDLWNEVVAVTVGINTCFCICFFPPLAQSNDEDFKSDYI